MRIGTRLQFGWLSAWALVVSVAMGLLLLPVAAGASPAYPSVDVRYIPLSAKTLDGLASPGEYPDATQAAFPTVSGMTTVSVSMDETYVWVHASIADSSAAGPPAFQVFLDTAFDRATLPQTDDYRLSVRRGTNVRQENRGDGTYWSTGGPGGWTSAVSEDAGTGFWGAEIRIERSALGLASRDQALGITFGEVWTPSDYWWPSTAFWLDPSSWGQAVSSDGWARTVYVSTEGSDTAGAGTPANPYRTIAKAYTSATSTQTIRLMPGTYAESVTMASGTWLVGSGSAVTTIAGNGAQSVIKTNLLSGSPVVSDLTVTGGGGDRGGGIYVTSGLRLRDLVVVDNHVTSGGQIGGGICVLAPVEMCRVLVADNSAQVGGGILFDGASNAVKLTDCVIKGNSASALSGGIHFGTIGALDMAGCTIVGNSAPSGAGIGAYNAPPGTPRGLIVWGNTGSADLDEDVSVTYSDVAGGAPGTGNIALDPRFESDGIHLQPTSPCIDAVEDFAGYGDLDLFGTPRPQDGDGDDAYFPDMGACEAMPPMRVNDGAEWTTSRQVHVVSNMNVCNWMRAACDGASTGWVGYQEDRLFTLPAGDGPKTVTADFSFFLGQTRTLTDTIKLDQTPPSVTALVCTNAATPSGAVPTTALRFEWAGADGYSGVRGYSWVFDQIPDTVPAASGAEKDLSAEYSATGDGTWYLHVRAQDVAGNWSETRHVAVTVQVPVPTSLSRPTVSPSRPRRGKYATFACQLSPASAASGGSVTLRLYRYETKTVRRKVHGTWRRVKVKYWRLRASKAMIVGAGGSASLRYKPTKTGTWKAVAVYSGPAPYLSGTSASRTFKVR